ncbi:excisionase [Burkholderia territorii]|uniref:excisionase n=1 Tax=Burkholderia territorii TaxID=1503055 RepID=UPI000A93409D|nr:excisionase [Burkholderia territorii]
MPTREDIEERSTSTRPKLIPLSVWAEEMFGEHMPHRHTLRNWVNNGKNRPVPIKVGRSYFVSPDARYVDPVAEEIQRMIDGR